MKRWHIFAIIACFITLIAGCSKEKPVPSDPVTQAVLISHPQKAAPLKELTFVKGGPVTLQAGHVYVVEFWATWCPPCRQSIPHLTQLQHRFKDKGVTMVGISNESVETVRSFVKKMGDTMDYTVAVDTKGTVGDGYMIAYKQRGIPTAFVVDGAGNVVWYGNPIYPMGTMDEAITRVLEKTTPGHPPIAAANP